MPHDKNGKTLRPGDLVTMAFNVTAVQTGEEYCNVSLESVEPMYPGEHKTNVTANARQVVSLMAEDHLREPKED